MNNDFAAAPVNFFGNTCQNRDAGAAAHAPSRMMRHWTQAQTQAQTQALPREPRGARRGPILVGTAGSQQEACDHGR